MLNKALSPHQVIQILLDKKAIQINHRQPFKWSSGILAPIYCDNRKLISYPNERSQILNSLISIISNMKYELLVGTATAGIPWCSMLAHQLMKPMLYVRTQSKEHGLKNNIEGELVGKDCIVIEDLISTGKSSLQVVKILKGHGLNVVAVVALFDYQLASAEMAFQREGTPRFCLASRKDLEQMLNCSIEIPEA